MCKEENKQPTFLKECSGEGISEREKDKRESTEKKKLPQIHTVPY